MLIISPILQSRIQSYQPINNKALQNASLPLNSGIIDNEAKNNVKSNKNIGKYIAIGLAVSAAVIGVVMLLKKGNAQFRIKKTINDARATFADALKFKSKALVSRDEAMSLGEDTQQRAEQLRQEVVKLFNDGGMRDGKKVAEIIEEGVISRMTERTAEGEISRVSEFDLNKVLKTIQEHIGDKTNEYHYNQNGILRSCALGVKKLTSGIIKTDKLMRFTNPDITGEPSVLSRYFEKLEQHKDNTFKAAKKMELDDKFHFFTYEEGFEGKGSVLARIESFKSKRRIDCDELGVMYTEHFSQLSRNHYEVRKMLEFQHNDTIKSYALNVKYGNRRNVASAKHLKFYEGEPEQYTEGYKCEDRIESGKNTFALNRDGVWIPPTPEEIDA